MSVTPTWAEIISEAIDAKLLDLHTALPGKIESYNASTQTADIQIQLKRPIQTESGTITSEELPVLPNVPIAFPRSSNFFVSFPLAAGDFVLVVFSELSLDFWRSKGSLCAPGDARRHSLSGGIAIPCLYPSADALAGASSNDMVLGEDGGQQVHIKTGGTVEITDDSGDAADDFVSMAQKTKDALDAIIGIFDEGVPIANDGGAALQTAWKSAGAAIDTDVSSSNLKADN